MPMHHLLGLRLRRRQSLAAGLALVVGVSTLTLVTTAPAASAAESCTRDRVCIFTNKDYTGFGITVPAYKPGTCLNLHTWQNGVFRDSITSFINNNEKSIWYENVGCKGYSIYVTGTLRKKNLRYEAGGWNDIVSSIYFY
jgi:hypothetical protein